METLAEKVGDVQILHLRGRLDLAAAGEFGALLDGIINGGVNKIVMDCRGLQYVSSSGLAPSFRAEKAWKRRKLVFAGLTDHIQDLFEMTGLANLFQICGSKEDALRQLASQ